MIEGKKYYSLGVGLGNINESVIDYHKNFLRMLKLESCYEILGSKGKANDCTQLLNPHFESFKEWCRDLYDEIKSDNDKAFFLFRDMLEMFKLSRDNSFYMKEDTLFHVSYEQPIIKDGNRIQQIAFTIHQYHEFTIACLKGYVDRLNKDTEKPSLKPTSRQTGFHARNHECLIDAYNQLINLEIISKDLSFKEFERIFSGHIPDKKIVWLKETGLLRYFIKEISGKGIIGSTNKADWKTTVSCFQNYEGVDYEIKHLQYGGTPERLKDINMVIDTFNDGFLKD